MSSKGEVIFVDRCCTIKQDNYNTVCCKCYIVATQVNLNIKNPITIFSFTYTTVLRILYPRQGQIHFSPDTDE